MADIKNFGIKGLSSDVQLGKSGGRLRYDSVNGRFDLTGSDGLTLENLRVGTVAAGTWAGDAIESQYGGLGNDFSSETGVVLFNDGTATAGAIDLSNASFVSGIVGIANGGTGADTASGARTNLGLGSIATQDSDNVAISGGAITGTSIAGSTGSFTTLAASAGITGDLTGDVTGNLTGDVVGDLTGDVTGTVSDISNHSTDALSEGSNNLYFTDARARGAISVTDAGGDGSLSYNSETGVITFTGPSAAEVQAHFSAGTGLEYSAGEFSLADTAVSAGDYGSTTAIPVISVDAQGRITSASTATIATSFDIAGDSGSDTVAGGETITFSGTANQVVTSVSDNEVTFSLDSDLSVNNLEVTGTLSSDDITASQVTVSGDAVITGNLTVQGTQTIVNTETVSVADAIIRVNSDGVGASAGFEANVGGAIESLLYVPSATVSPDTNNAGAWVFSDDVIATSTVKASDFVGNLTGDVTGDVTGTVSDISNHSTTDLSEGDNLYFTDARARSAISADGDLSYNSETGVVSFTERTDAEVRGLISVVDNGGDGSLAYNSATGVITFTGPSAAEVQAHFSAGAGLEYSAGEFSMPNSGVTAGEYGSATEVPVFTVDAQGRVTEAGTTSISTSLDLTGDSGSDTVAGGEAINFEGGSNLTSTVTDNNVAFALDADISVDTVTATGAIEGASLTDGTATLTGGNLTASGATVSGSVEASTLTDGTASLSAGSLTSAVNGSFSGTVTAGAVTDGTATLSGGALSGVSTGTFSGQVQAGTLTDGTASISGGDITGAGDITASGAVQFGTLSDGTLSITGFVDEDNMISDSASLVPTQQSVKAYVDSKVTAQDVDFGGDTGTGSVDLDSQTLTIAGGDNLTTSADGQTLTVSLDSDLTGLNSVTATSFTGNITGSVTGNVTGNVTGDLTGDVTGQVSDISNHSTSDLAEGDNLYYTQARFDSALTAKSTSDLSEGTNLYHTTARARSALSAGTGVTYNSTTGQISIGQAVGTTDNVTFGTVAAGTFTGDLTGDVTGNADTATALANSRQFSASGDATASAVAFDGTQNVDLALTLANSGVSAGDYGSTTEVPVLSIDSKGRVTSASTATIVTSFNIGADNGTDDTVSGGEKLTISGTANQVVTTVTDNEINVALADDLSVGNITVTGTLNSDDITASQVTVDGDTVITGNLTVNGTQTVVNSTVVSVDDAVFRVNSDGDSTSAGIEANIGGTIESVVYNPATSRWELSGEVFTADGFRGDLTGDVTGQVSDISNHSTTDLSEGDNLYFTEQRARDVISGGTGVSYNSTTGELAIGQAVGTADDVQFNTVTADLVGNADTATKWETARDLSLTGDASATLSSVDGSQNVSAAVTLATVNANVGTFGSATQVPVVTVNGKGLVTGVSTANVATQLNIAGDSGTDALDLLSDTFTVEGGSNLTTSVSDNKVSVALDSEITLTTVNANLVGNVTGDVTGNLTGDVTGNVTGNLTGDVTGDVTGNVTGNLTGNVTGDLTGNVTAGSVSFTSLSDGTTAVDTIETSLTDVDTAVPTSAAVVEYVANNAGDGLLLRGQFSADSSASAFAIGTMPNVSARTYYAEKIVVKVGTAFSGGTFDHIIVKENDGNGATILGEFDADAGSAGVYVVELGGDQQLTKGASVVVEFKQADGTTAAVTTAGSMTASVHYNWV